MKSLILRLLPALGALSLAIGSSAALAQCGLQTASIKPASWQPNTGGVHLLLADYDDDDNPSVVGMWHVVFTANKMSGATIPNTVIDNALVVWHSDHTEIMNSARPPQDGNFCLGVWAKTGYLRYHLNHFPWLSNDTTDSNGVVGNPVGPTRIVEDVVVSPDGSHYTGTFTLSTYDTKGNPGVYFSGTLSGTRITVNTTIPQIY